MIITEDYVSFEIAKLLKESGFDGDTNCYYIEGSVDKNLCYSPIRQNHNKRITNNEFGIDIDITNSKISAPTLQMATKWLRKNKGIAIVPIISRMIDHERFLFDVKIVVAKTNDKYIRRWFYEEPEEACEDAIKYCLENLI